MAPPPDISSPSSWTYDNIPFILGALVAQMEQNTKDHAEIKGTLLEQAKTLKDHEADLKIFRFSRCDLIPWISRNRWVVTVIIGFFSLWSFALGWLERWSQWSFFPPRLGP